MINSSLNKDQINRYLPESAPVANDTNSGNFIFAGFFSLPSYRFLSFVSEQFYSSARFYSSAALQSPIYGLLNRGTVNWYLVSEKQAHWSVFSTILPKSEGHLSTHLPVGGIELHWYVKLFHKLHCALNQHVILVPAIVLNMRRQGELMTAQRSSVWVGFCGIDISLRNGK